MDLALQIYESVKPLSPSAAQDVLDFGEFLSRRQARQEERDLMLAQQTVITEWDNAADEVWNDAPAV